MKKSLAALLVLPFLIAGCGDGAGNSSAPAAPVASVAPPAGQSWVDTVVKTPEGGYRMGNPNAPIKLIEYGARSCPTCGAFGREGMRPLEEKYIPTGKVSYEFRDFLVHGVSDLPGALLGVCGGAAPFFSLLEGMYVGQNDYLDRIQRMTPADQQRMQAMTPTQGVTFLAEQGGMIEFVKQRGIPEAKARQCLNDQQMLETLSKSTEKWGQDGTVTGTPTFYINGEKYTGAPSWQELEPALKNAGA